MPSLADVVDLLHAWYPPRTADSWDAVGLVAGDPSAEVARVMFAVDPTVEVAREAVEWGADLLVVHHPLFLTPVSSVAADTPKGRTLHTLAAGGCALLTAHTNADQAVSGVSESLALALGLTDLAPIRPGPAGTARQDRGVRAGRLGGGRPHGHDRRGRGPARSYDSSPGPRRARAGSARSTAPRPRSERSATSRWSRRPGSRRWRHAVVVRRWCGRCWPRTPTRSRPSTWSRSPTPGWRPRAPAGSARSREMTLARLRRAGRGGVAGDGPRSPRGR